MTPPPRIEKLRADHPLDTFDCGREELNRFLKRHAWSNQQAHSAQTYVLVDDGRVAGYYSLAAGAIAHERAAERVRKGQARHPIPVVIPARLAVDKSRQGRGLGAALLKDALLRTARAADTIGARALVVHAMDERAISFYRHFDFDSNPADPLFLWLLMKDLRRLISK